MKVACPQCGQHYEIDSNMLDRYYRCTECKTLFWGLKAKSVKPVVYKIKDDPESGEIENTPVDGESAVNPEEVVDSSAPDCQDEDKKEILIAVDGVSEKTSVKETKNLPVYDERFDDSSLRIEPVMRLGAVNGVLLVAIIVIACCLLGVVLYFNSVNKELRSSCRSLLEAQKGLQNKISSVESSQDKLSNELNSVRSQFDQFKRSAAKNSDLRETAEKLAVLEAKLTGCDEKLADALQKINRLQEDALDAERERGNTSNSGSSGRRNR